MASSSGQLESGRGVELTSLPDPGAAEGLEAHLPERLSQQSLLSPTPAPDPRGSGATSGRLSAMLLMAHKHLFVIFSRRVASKI